MRYLVLALLFLVGCGSNALNVRSLDEGTLGDRYLNLLESQFALVAKSSSAADAVSRIEVYCAREAVAIGKISEESADLSEAELKELGKSIAPRFEKIVERAEAELEDKTHILADTSVLTAMAACAPKNLTAEPTP